MNATKIAITASAVIAATLPTIATIKAIKGQTSTSKLLRKRNPIKTVAYIANTLTA